MRRLAIALAAATLALTTTTAPAHAGWPGGSVQHASDDSGYNPPISVHCDNGRTYTLGLGTWSRTYCGDVDLMYVGPGDQIKCRHNDGRWELFDATGWHGIGNFTQVLCYQQKD